VAPEFAKAFANSCVKACAGTRANASVRTPLHRLAWGEAIRPVLSLARVMTALAGECLARVGDTGYTVKSKQT